MNKQELFLSLDVEADGPGPLRSSMLSFAMVAMDIDKRVHSTFSLNLEEQDGHSPHPDTMRWWMSTPEHQEAYKATRRDTLPIQEGMDRWREWVLSLPTKEYVLIPVAWPAGYDYLWLNAYALAYGNTSWPENPLRNACLDGKSFALGLLPEKNYRHMNKGTYPKHWFDQLPHTHVAEEDALEQACLFVNALREARNLVRIPGYTTL